MQQLKNKKVAILATSGFEEIELLKPASMLEDAGAEIFLLSNQEEIVSWHNKQWNKAFKTDQYISQSRIEDFDIVILPGGVINPDLLRRDKEAVKWLKEYYFTGKPIAAICHGPQLLIEAGVIKGKKLTSFYSIKTDLKNAGARWVDEPVVVDDNIITSRKPDDIDDFVNAIVALLNYHE